MSMAFSTEPTRVRRFCDSYALDVPVLMAPMAGASPVALAGAVADAGGMGACGALLMAPDDIAQWAARFRARSNGAFQMNLWVPDPEPVRDPAHETCLAGFLAHWGRARTCLMVPWCRTSMRSLPLFWMPVRRLCQRSWGC